MNTTSILIIEDYHDIRVAFRQVFEEQGYRVHSVANGVDGMKILRRENPSLILLDLMMPLMNGQDFLSTKNSDPQLQSIPVIVMSASSEELKKIEGLPKLKKPVNIEELTNTVEKILNQR